MPLFQTPPTLSQGFRSGFGTAQYRLTSGSITPMDRILATSSRLALIGLGLAALVMVLDQAQMIIAPVSLAVVIGLMFGPLADRVERFGVPASVSAIAVVLLFLGLVIAAVAAFAVPLAGWLDTLPQIWTRLQSEMTNWRGLFASLTGLQEELRQALGESSQLRVQVAEAPAVTDVAFLAPAILGQMILFLASLYFFVATRHDIRKSVLTLCVRRRVRWRFARVFRESEAVISAYLLHITGINLALGAAVSLAMWAAGVPSPLLWGVLAGLLNYVIYIGPAILTFLLLGVGLASGGSTLDILTPAVIYLTLNLVEAQIVTPHVLGRMSTLNPFVIFLAIVFWIWLWGPAGGFIAVPFLLLASTILRILVTQPIARRRQELPAPVSAAVQDDDLRQVNPDPA